jgi:hypothetical protein
MLAKIQQLGAVVSFNRPSVSDDNQYMKQPLHCATKQSKAKSIQR